MRAVVTRVLNAAVTVDGEVVGKIGHGLLALIGLSPEDTDADLQYVSDKLLRLKLFEHEGAQWKRSVTEIDGELLCVSQFTLFASVKKNKPDFSGALVRPCVLLCCSDPVSLPSRRAKCMAASSIDCGRNMRPTRSKVRPVIERIPDRADGRFAAMMEVASTNDGPVTIVIDSSRDRPASSQNDAADAKAARRAEIEARTARNAAEKEAQREHAASNGKSSS